MTVSQWVWLGTIAAAVAFFAWDIWYRGAPRPRADDPFGWAPDIPTWVSLVAIIGILVVTTVASLLRIRVLDRAGDSPGVGDLPEGAAGAHGVDDPLGSIGTREHADLASSRARTPTTLSDPPPTL